MTSPGSHVANPDGLWLDDLAVGMQFHSPVVLLREEDIIAFAEQFDPQAFHLSATAARDSFFEGLAASGWHTAALSMKLLAQALPLATGIIGKGVEIEWPSPTRPNDELRVVAQIDTITPSKSRPDRGSITVGYQTLNQSGDIRQRARITLIGWKRHVGTQATAPGAESGEKAIKRGESR
ncbi:MaoC/PaaZ C-terminal domain-containing protein [Pseudarthrobacter sp. J1738]|uniref:MaoC/PaaZ C-terminal domain-containing protein n=1 Tax=Micrococcales TaxID=85006 RepID=UPI003B7C8A11